MDRVFSLAFLVGGVALVVFGIRASHSLSSDISRFFTHLPTDKAIWMMVGGAMAGFIGLVGLMRESRTTA